MAKESATHGARAPVAAGARGARALVEHAFGSPRDAAAATTVAVGGNADAGTRSEYVDGDMLRGSSRECGKDAFE